MAEHKSPLKEFRQLDDKRRTSGLDPSEEARWAALRDLVQPGPPARGFDVNAAAAELRAFLAPASPPTRPQAPPAPSSSGQAAPPPPVPPSIDPWDLIDLPALAGVPAGAPPARVVQADAQALDAGEPPYDADALPFDADVLPSEGGSQPWDQAARATEPSAQPWDPNAPPYDPNAPPYDQAAPPFDAGAQPWDPSAQPNDPNAPPYDQAAPPSDAGAQAWDPNAPPAEAGNQPWEQPAQPVDFDAQPWDPNAPPYEPDAPPYDGSARVGIQDSRDAVASAPSAIRSRWSGGRALDAPGIAPEEPRADARRSPFGEGDAGAEAPALAQTPKSRLAAEPGPIAAPEPDRARPSPAPTGEAAFVPKPLRPPAPGSPFARAGKPVEQTMELPLEEAAPFLAPADSLPKPERLAAVRGLAVATEEEKPADAPVPRQSAADFLADLALDQPGAGFPAGEELQVVEMSELQIEEIPTVEAEEIVEEAEPEALAVPEPQAPIAPAGPSRAPVPAPKVDSPETAAPQLAAVAPTPVRAPPPASVAATPALVPPLAPRPSTLPPAAPREFAASPLSEATVAPLPVPPPAREPSAPAAPPPDVARALAPEAPWLTPAPDGLPEPASASPEVPPSFVAGTHRVVVHTIEGQVLRGTLSDADLDAPEVPLAGTDGSTSALPASRVKAIFFMLPQGGRPPVPEGRRVRVTFADGRQVAGFSPDYRPGGPGFFMVPADTRTNTGRIWVYRSALRDVAVS